MSEKYKSRFKTILLIPIIFMETNYFDKLDAFNTNHLIRYTNESTLLT
jgi:hypothetical protein